jgi:hypothetical protein
MPDVVAAERFITQISRIEVQAVQATIRHWRSVRADLLDGLSRDPQAITRLVQRVGYDLAQITRETPAQAAQAARSYAAAQLPTADTFIAENAADALAAGLPAWQAATIGRFLTDAQRLQAAGVTGDALALALTATQADRQSAWAWALTALQLATEAAVWQRANDVLRTTYTAAERRSRTRYQKQAIAAIDSRTTNCCLQVHGQIVDLDQSFTLTGTPRFADRLPQPPFHHRCRTVIALYAPEMEAVGITTSDMRAQARAQFAASSASRTR